MEAERIHFFWEGKRKSVHLSQVIWMAANETMIPSCVIGDEQKFWEIHHLDEDPANNHQSNLICVHPRDHVKIHHNSPDMEDPF